MKLSVILPSIRPTLLDVAVWHLERAMRWTDSELVVIADFPDCTLMNWPKTTWVERPRAGTIDAICAGVKAAHGDWIFITNDETVVEEETIEKLLLAAQDEMVVYTPKHLPEFPFYYYGRYFAAFPMAHRRLIDRVGGLFDPVYRSFYADPDFSMRVHEAGLKIQVVENAIIRHSNDVTRPDHVHNLNAYCAADRETFRKRWDHLGEFRDP